MLIGGGAWFIFGDNKEEKNTESEALPEENVESEAFPEENVECEVLPETSAPYKVGDLYNVKGKQGVVFEVSDGDLHGKIVSLDETSTCWIDADDWCNKKDGDWYLPAKEELMAIFKNELAINSTLVEYNAEQISGYYWSSTEDEDELFGEGGVAVTHDHTYGGDKYYGTNYVRAVSAF